MVINVPDEVAQRLERLAKEQGSSVGDQPVDTAERSREILTSEFAEYLRRS